jgi:hypothetical protein
MNLPIVGGPADGEELNVDDWQIGQGANAFQSYVLVIRVRGTKTEVLLEWSPPDRHVVGVYQHTLATRGYTPVRFEHCLLYT